MQPSRLLHHTATRPRGFTLIELIASMLIASVLSMIAMPAYSGYLARSKLRAAQSDLIALSLNVENYYQQQLSYPSATAGTTQTQTTLPGWAPAQAANFSFQIQSASASTYSLKAIGTGNGVSGYTITLDSSNTRQLTNPAGAVSSW